MAVAAAKRLAATEVARSSTKTTSHPA
jgi:hypothetical protein